MTKSFVLLLVHPTIKEQISCVDKIVWSKNHHTLGMFKQGFMQPAAPALLPIRGVRVESDPGSTFNAFIKDARLIDRCASTHEVKASERDLTIVIDSSVLAFLHQRVPNYPIRSQ